MDKKFTPGLRQFYVLYVDDTDEDNQHSYSVKATSARKASDLVSDYIDEHNHHKSINYGFTLKIKQSKQTAEFIIS